MHVRAGAHVCEGKPAHLGSRFASQCRRNTVNHLDRARLHIRRRATWCRGSGRVRERRRPWIMPRFGAFHLSTYYAKDFFLRSFDYTVYALGFIQLWLRVGFRRACSFQSYRHLHFSTDCSARARLYHRTIHIHAFQIKISKELNIPTTKDKTSTEAA